MPKYSVAYVIEHLEKEIDRVNEKLSKLDGKRRSDKYAEYLEHLKIYLARMKANQDESVVGQSFFGVGIAVRDNKIGAKQNEISKREDQIALKTSEIEKTKKNSIKRARAKEIKRLQDEIRKLQRKSGRIERRQAKVLSSKYRQDLSDMWALAKAMDSADNLSSNIASRGSSLDNGSEGLRAVADNLSLAYSSLRVGMLSSRLEKLSEKKPNIRFRSESRSDSELAYRAAVTPQNTVSQGSLSTEEESLISILRLKDLIEYRDYINSASPSIKEKNAAKLLKVEERIQELSKDPYLRDTFYQKLFKIDDIKNLDQAALASYRKELNEMLVSGSLSEDQVAIVNDQLDEISIILAKAMKPKNPYAEAMRSKSAVVTEPPITSRAPVEPPITTRDDSRQRRADRYVDASSAVVKPSIFNPTFAPLGTINDQYVAPEELKR